MSKIKNIVNNHVLFESDIERILQYAGEIVADLPYRRNVSKDEKYLLLESLVLRSCALWEKFLEKELILAVHLNHSNIAREMNLRKNTKLDIDLIRAILFSDTFRDFHDIDKLKNVFSKYISDRFNLCKQLSNKQIKNIQFIYKIRNYLSHYSHFSRIKLFEAYKKEYRMNRFIEPGQFLMKQKGKRFQELTSNFQYASINMKKVFRRC